MKKAAAKKAAPAGKKPMTKSQLVSLLAEKVGITKKQVTDLLGELAEDDAGTQPDGLEAPTVHSLYDPDSETIPGVQQNR